MYIHFFVGKRW